MPDGRQLSESVASHVREAIMVGDLPGHGYLRTEHLAAELGVSATPVREALMILQGEGAIRWEPRRGYRVLPLTPGDVEDLFGVQAFVAGELAARAAALLDGDAVADLRAVQEQLVDAAARGEAERVERLNHDIHRTINRAGGTGRLTALLRQTVSYVPRHYYARVQGWERASVHDHDDVLDALAAGDRESARAAMARHVRHIGVLLDAHLRERGAYRRETL
jgi:DNA-binding GntR family transcriptional regulator